MSDSSRYRYSFLALSLFVYTPMLIANILRSWQTDGTLWLACDYLGRGATLCLIFLITPLRKSALQTDKLKQFDWKIAAYGVAFTLLSLFYLRYLRPYINHYLPFTLSSAPFPNLSGFFALFDLFFGTLLVACSEELVFRKILLINILNFNRGAAFSVVSSGIIFGLHHFLRDASSIILSVIAGFVLMAIYLSSRSLIAVIVIHFILDFIPELYYYSW